MERAGTAALTPEQSRYHAHLSAAAEDVMKAGELLSKNNNDAANQRATALALTAIARVFVLDTADKYGLSERIPALVRAPK